MGKTAFRYLCALLAILFASCSKEGPLDKMEHIKMVGNDHPKQALAMLDSLEQEARRGSVYAQKKWRRGNSPWIAPALLTKYLSTTEHEERQVADSMNLCPQPLYL